MENQKQTGKIRQTHEQLIATEDFLFSIGTEEALEAFEDMFDNYLHLCQLESEPTAQYITAMYYHLHRYLKALDKGNAPVREVYHAQ